MMTSFYKLVLSKEILMANTENISKFLGEFLGESDRSAVILGTAKLDQLLCNLLTSFFLPNTHSTDELFDGDAPLSTFHSKILLVYRLGLIDKYFACALHIIRKIRNSFAHETSGCTFETGPHKDRITELKRLFKNKDFFNLFKTNFLKEHKDKGASADFRCALAIMEIRLEGAIFQISSINDNTPWTLDPPKMESQNNEVGPGGPAPGE